MNIGSNEKKPLKCQKHEYTSIEMAPISNNDSMISNVTINMSSTKNLKEPRQSKLFLPMIISLLLCGIFFQLSSSFVAFEGNTNQNSYKMPKKYHTVIELSMPYLGLKEPFEIWSDMDNGLQHIDYWGTLNRFYLNRSGPGCQIMPISVDGKSSVEIIAQIPLWEPAVVFPDLNMKHAPFIKSSHEEKIRGIDCDVWELNETDYDPEAEEYIGEYKYYLSKENQIPIRMSFLGHNVITNSHFDNYTFDYLIFEDKSNFDLSMIKDDLILKDGCSMQPSLYFDDDLSNDNSHSKRLKIEEKVQKAEDENAQLPISGPSGHTNGPTKTMSSNGEEEEEEEEENTNGLSLVGLSSVTQHFSSLMPGKQAQKMRSKAWHDYQDQFTDSTSSSSTLGQQPGYKMNTNGIDQMISPKERIVLFRNTQRIVTSVNHQHLSYNLEMNNMADWTDAEKKQRRGRIQGSEAEAKNSLAQRTARMGGLLKDYDVEAANNAFLMTSSHRRLKTASSPITETSTSETEIASETAVTTERNIENVIDNMLDITTGKPFNDLDLDDDTINDDSEKPMNPTIDQHVTTNRPNDNGKNGNDMDMIEDTFAQWEDTESNKLIQDIFKKNINQGIEGLKAHDLALKDTEVLSDLAGLTFNLPLAVDWRKVIVVEDNDENDDENEEEGKEYSVVGPIKDQGTCGSCWTFGTAGAVETHAAIRQLGIDPQQAVVSPNSSPPPYHDTTPGRVTLSEQSIVDCAWPFGVQGCDGGEDDLAFLWIMDIGGLPTTKA